MVVHLPPSNRSVRANSILTRWQQEVLRALVLQGPSHPYGLSQHLRGLGYSTSQTVLKRLVEAGYACELGPRKGRRGGPPQRIYNATKAGVWIFCCTMLENVEEARELARRHGDIFPLSLGKWGHYKETGSEDLAVQAWKNVNPFFEVPIKAGKVTIYDPAFYSDPDTLFYLEADRHLRQLGRDKWDKWNDALGGDPQLARFRDKIYRKIREAYESAGPELILEKAVG